jgi:hypothetical protein
MLANRRLGCTWPWPTWAVLGLGQLGLYLALAALAVLCLGQLGLYFALAALAVLCLGQLGLYLALAAWAVLCLGQLGRHDTNRTKVTKASTATFTVESIFAGILKSVWWHFRDFF